MKETVKILVPSFKRQDNVKTVATVANCAIVCPDRQVAEYQANYPDVEIIGHPDDCYGINQARQWIYENYPNCMMLDDDITHVVRMLEPAVYDRVNYPDSASSNNLTPEEAYEVIQRTAMLAKEMGTYLFGFTSAVNPRDVRDFAPFTINGYVKGTTMGMLEGSKLHFPMEEDGRISEDHYVTLLNAFHHRYNLVDNRYAFIHVGTFKTKGGCSDYRTSEAEEKAYKFLKKKFGDAIQLKGEGVSNTGKVVQRTHAFERVINIPF